MSLARLSECLDALAHVCPVDASEALETLSIYMDNIIQTPLEKKFRTIRISNINFQERLGHLNGNFLEAIGFEVHGEFLRLDSSMYVVDRTADTDDDTDDESPTGAAASVQLRGTSLDVLRRMRALVERHAQRMRLQWIDYVKTPSETHSWTSIADFSAADEIGRRPSMEDEFIAVDGFNNNPRQGFFALYDGHGGRPTVEFSVRALHLNFAQNIKMNPQKPVAQAFEEAYLKTDGQVRRQNIMSSGATAVTCLLRDAPSDSAAGGSASSGMSRWLHVANVGDSRAVLCRAGRAVRLTKDHKATDPEEAARVVAQGGFVGRFNRVNGILAISRALGDHLLKQVVSALPYTTDTELNASDDFFILACDGVWDVLSDQDAVDFVLHQVRAGVPIAALARSLIQLSLEKNTTDNVSVMIVFLNKPPNLWAQQHASKLPTQESSAPLSTGGSSLMSAFHPPSPAARQTSSLMSMFAQPQHK